jgi:CRP/FNR family transcriptional regulator, cyclic AMP receptor protein
MYEDALSRVDLFSGLGKKVLKEVALCCREATYKPGSVLISQGEKGVGMFLLTKGTVRITQTNNSGGAEQALGTLEAGDVFGEMALLDDLPRSATVTAIDEVTALLVPFWDFRIILRHLLSSDPNIGLELMAVLSRRLRKAEQRVTE